MEQFGTTYGHLVFSLIRFPRKNIVCALLLQFYFIIICLIELIYVNSSNNKGKKCVFYSAIFLNSSAVTPAHPSPTEIVIAQKISLKG